MLCTQMFVSLSYLLVFRMWPSAYSTLPSPKLHQIIRKVLLEKPYFIPSAILFISKLVGLVLLAAVCSCQCVFLGEQGELKAKEKFFPCVLQNGTN